MCTPFTLTNGSSAPHSDADDFTLMGDSDILTAVCAHRPTNHGFDHSTRTQSTTKRLLRSPHFPKSRNTRHIFTHRIAAYRQIDTTFLPATDYYDYYTIAVNGITH